MPTLDEAGLKGYGMTTWFALMAPHGAPPERVARLNAEVACARCSNRTLPGFSGSKA